MSQTPRRDVHDLGSIRRVDQLGIATERLFSRLYKGLGRRANQQAMQGDQARQLQRALRKRDLEIERLNSIIASLGDGIIMQDNEGRIVLVNAAARALLGSQKAFWESELGTLFNEYSSLQRLDSEMALLGEPTRVQVNNKVIGAQLAAVADSQGNRLGTVIVLRDVTDEELANRLKDQFITAISHELRTPMAVIKGMSEVLMAQPSDAKPNRRLLETLSRNVDVLDRMIIELLDISELSAGNFSLRHMPINLEGLVWSVIKGLTPEIKRARLYVLVMVRNTGELALTGDEQRLRWALGHLVQNSIRYTEPGGRIIVAASRADDNRVAVQVNDNGVGISDKDMPRIFERFYRGEPRTRSGKLLDPRGLGQGLYIARAVTEAHGGYLSVQSQPGQGSVFTMVLPT